MNVGPWNDNIQALSEYGGMPLPMQDGSKGRWGAPGFDPQKVDWTKLKETYGPKVTDATLTEMTRYKQKTYETLGLAPYMASRRRGAEGIARDGKGGWQVNPSLPSDKKRDVDRWIAGQSSVAADFLQNPARRTDGKRYQIDYEAI
jgi:hypothetical protein